MEKWVEILKNSAESENSAKSENSSNNFQKSSNENSENFPEDPSN